MREATDNATEKSGRLERELKSARAELAETKSTLEAALSQNTEKDT